MFSVEKAKKIEIKEISVDMFNNIQTNVEHYYKKIDEANKQIICEFDLGGGLNNYTTIVRKKNDGN